MNQIRGLIFDIENVFFDGTYWHRQLRQLLAKLGRQLELGTLRSDWQRDFLPRIYSGELQYWDALATYIANLGIQGCEGRELLASARTKLQLAQSKLRPLPGAVEAVAKFRSAGLRLAVLCNSIHSSSQLSSLLKSIGISTQFETILTSRASGRVLPDKSSLNQVSRQMDLPPETIGYLSGDQERLKIATSVGMTAFQANSEWALSFKNAKTDDLAALDWALPGAVRQLYELYPRWTAA